MPLPRSRWYVRNDNSYGPAFGQSTRHHHYCNTITYNRNAIIFGQHWNNIIINVTITGIVRGCEAGANPPGGIFGILRGGVLTARQLEKKSNLAKKKRSEGQK